MDAEANRMPESWLSSRNEARIAALSFWITARSSAMVFADRTLRMNCLTVDRLDCVVRMHLRGEEGRRAALTGRHGDQRDPRRGEEGRYSMERKGQSQVQVDEPSTALIKPMKQKKCQGCWSGGLDLLYYYSSWQSTWHLGMGH